MEKGVSQVVGFFFRQYYETIIMCIFLIVFILSMRSFDVVRRRRFLIIATSILLVCVTDTIELYYASMATPCIQRVIVSCISYYFKNLVLLEIIYAISIDISKQDRILLAIPQIFLGFACIITAISGHGMFYYNQENLFVRSNLGFLPFAVSSVYIVHVVVYSIRKWIRGRWPEAIVLLVLTISCVMATILEACDIFEICLNATMAASVSFFYMYLYAQRYNYDTVTGALKRRCLYSDAKNHKRKNMAIFSIDLNCLKQINDTYGHEEGDRALETLGREVQNALDYRCHLYRVGGDEFVILGIRIGEEEAKNIMYRIRTRMEATKYRCAIGLAFYQPKDNFEEVLRRADQAMYENKKQMKKNIVCQDLG